MHLFLTGCRKIQRRCQFVFESVLASNLKKKSDVKALFSCQMFGNLSLSDTDV